MWDLGECVASDEATRGFKGKCSKKSVIKLKSAMGIELITFMTMGLNTLYFYGQLIIQRSGASRISALLRQEFHFYLIKKQVSVTSVNYKIS